MERCPICRARLRGALKCPRCGADLGLLARVERHAEALERQAIAALARGQGEQARDLLRESLGLKEEPLARALLGLVPSLAPPGRRIGGLQGGGARGPRDGDS